MSKVPSVQVGVFSMQRGAARLAAILIVALTGMGPGGVPGAEASASLAAGAPVLTVPGPQTVQERDPLAFDVSAVDPEGQAVELRASNLPSGATFVDRQNNTGAFDWTPDSFQAGSYLVFFTADDTFGGVATRSVSIDVLNANNAPELNPIVSRTVDQGSTVAMMLFGADPDGDALEFQISGLPPYATFSDYGDGTASLLLAPTSSTPPGTTTVTVTLSDGALTDEETFTITVAGTAVLHPPTLSAIANQTVSEGASASVPVTASDVDGDALSWTVSLPGFVSFVPTSSGPGSASATLSVAPGYCASGSYPGTVSINDGGMSATRSFTIQVPNVNRTPVWEGPYATTLLEGSTVDVPVRALDPDQSCGGAAAALSIVSSDAGPALAASLTAAGDGSGVLHLTAAPAGGGSYRIVLRAVDSGDPGVAPETEVRVDVGHMNRRPAAEAGGPYGGLVGALIVFDGSASSDPDGDALTYAWDFGDGSQGSAVAPAHAFAAAGSYHVVLTVSDGLLDGVDTATATVASTYEARAWSDPGVIRLRTGKPRETVLLEPVGGSFDLTSIDLLSLELCAPPGTGSVECIRPIPEKTAIDRDRDRNGVLELAMEFTKEDLRRLLANLTEPTTLSLAVQGDFAGGAALRAGLTVHVIPEKHRVLRRVSPNPMNPVAVISITTNRSGPVRLRVYDMTGRLVRTLLDGGQLPAGDHDVAFDGRDHHGHPLASGHYYVRIEASGQTDRGTLTMLK